MKINRNAIIQYFLIYLMLVFNGANLYINFSKQHSSLYWLLLIAIVGVGLFSYVYKPKKYKNMYCCIILAIVFASIVVVRYTAGGVGVKVFIEYAAHVFLTFLAVSVNKEKFAQRLINSVYVLAIISLICYVIQLVKPEILKMFLKRAYLGQFVQVYCRLSAGLGAVVFLNERGRNATQSGYVQ